MEEETWFVEDGRRRGVDVFWLLIGEESWEGERHWGPERGDFFCSLDSKTCSPKTKLKMDGTHQSLPYILASVIASDSALCIKYLSASANLWTGSCMCTFCFVMVLNSHPAEGSLLQGTSMSYVSQCLAQGPVTRAGFAERAEKP